MAFPGKSWDLAAIARSVEYSRTLLRCASCKIPTFARTFDLFAWCFPANLGTLLRLRIYGAAALRTVLLWYQAARFPRYFPLITVIFRSAANTSAARECGAHGIQHSAVWRTPASRSMLNGK